MNENLNAYIVIIAKSIPELVNKVNIFFNQGWMPNNGISYSSEDQVYMQSMIKYSNKSQKIEDNSSKKTSEPSKPEPPVVANLNDEPEKEWDPEFWKVVSLEFSGKTMLFISKKYVRSIKELLSRITEQNFKEEAGKEIIDEIQKFIQRKGWK
jgi:hypothetical protein